MCKWNVKINSKTYSFEDFDKAVSFYREEIINHINNNDIFFENGLPFQAGAYFGYKFDNGTITDKEIVMESRLSLLLSSLKYSDLKDSELNASKVIKKNIFYNHVEKEINTKVILSIRKNLKNIILDLSINDGDDAFIKTNSFLFNKEISNFYFKSHQLITTSENSEKLGKKIDLDIELEAEK